MHRVLFGIQTPFLPLPPTDSACHLSHQLPTVCLVRSVETSTRSAASSKGPLLKSQATKTAAVALRPLSILLRSAVESSTRSAGSSNGPSLKFWRTKPASTALRPFTILLHSAMETSTRSAASSEGPSLKPQRTKPAPAALRPFSIHSEHSRIVPHSIKLGQVYLNLGPAHRYSTAQILVIHEQPSAHTEVPFN